MLVKSSKVGRTKVEAVTADKKAVDCQPCSDDQTQGSESLPPRTSTNRKPGRPKGLTNLAIKANKLDPTGNLAKATAHQERAGKVKSRQVKDCERLSAKLTTALKRRELTSDDLGKITRAVALLHDLERNAYGLGAKDSQSQKIIMIPVRQDGMDQWQQDSNPQLPRTRPPGEAACVGVIEDDIQGEAPEGMPDGDQQDEEGAA